MLVAEGDETSVTVTARGAAGGEVVVIEAGTCAAGTASPEHLLEDLDPTGRSETTVPASLGDLSGGAYSIAIHRSAEAYGDVVACGDIVPTN